MSTLHNEEIRAIQVTIAQLKRGIPLEPNQGKREKMKQSVKELDEILQSKLMETPDYADIKIEEDIY